MPSTEPSEVVRRLLEADGEELTSVGATVARIVVRWGDMDALGHVNNVTYLTYAMHARTEWFQDLWERKAHDVESLPQFVVKKLDCEYIRPVVWPDTVYVRTALEKVGRSSLEMVHRMVSEKQTKVVAVSRAVLVAIDDQGRTHKSIDLKSRL